MNLAARELGILSAAKAREHVLATARRIRAETNQAPDPRLSPTLILTSADRAYASQRKAKAA